MSKYWDITRRRKEKRITSSEKKQRKLNASWLFFLCLMGAFFLAFAGVSKIPQFSGSSLPTPTSSQSVKSVSTKPNLKIKLINGTGLFEELSKYKTSLAQ